MMKIIEIIHVRLSANMPQSLSKKIRRSIGDEVSSEVFTIFQRDNLESDLAVHIHRNENNTQCGPSLIGIHLASSLKEFGLVEHTVWKELLSS
jgi:hypothetical protein